MYKVVATIDTPDTRALAEKLQNATGCTPNFVEQHNNERRLVWTTTCYWVADRILQSCRRVEGATVTME